MFVSCSLDGARPYWLTITPTFFFYFLFLKIHLNGSISVPVQYQYFSTLIQDAFYEKIMEKRTRNGWPMNSLDSRCATTAYKVIIWEHLSRWSFGIVFNHCRYPHIYYHLVALFHSETITKRCDTSMNLVNQSIELVISIIPIANANRVENFLSKKKKGEKRKRKISFAVQKE